MLKNYKTIFKIKCKNREIKQMQEHQSVQVYLKDLTANLQPNQTFSCKSSAYLRSASYPLENLASEQRSRNRPLWGGQYRKKE